MIFKSSNFFKVCIGFYFFYIISSALGSEEAYSDITPRVKPVFTHQFELPDWWEKSESLQIKQSHLNFKLQEPSLAKVGHSLVYPGFGGKEPTSDFITGKFGSRDYLEEITIHEIIYLDQVLDDPSLSFPADPCKIPFKGGLVEAQRMSWKWVYHAYQNMIVKHKRLHWNSEKAQKVQYRITRDGLENSLIRIASITDIRGRCTYFAVFDTEEEESKATVLLSQLQAALRK